MKKRGSTLSQASSQQKFNPRSDPRINGNGSHWPKTRESLASRTSAGGSFSQRPGTTGVTAGLRPGYYSEMTMESHDVKMHAPKEKCTLPHWCVYIAYVICLMLSAFSTVMVVLYCFQFGYSESMQWLLALILSLVMSFLVIEPLKAFLIAVYVVAMMKSVEEDEDDDQIEIKPTFDNSNEKIKDEKFRPIGGFALVRAKEEGRRIHRMNIMIRQFVAYVFYLWLMMAIVYIHFSYNSYLMTKQVECDFFTPKTASGQNFSRIRSIEEFWDWTENVYTDSLYLKDTATDEEHGYLLGPARMRLIRGLTSKCQASNAAAHYGASTLTDRTCHGEGQYEEDTGTYTEGWNGSNSNGSWKHYSATQLGSTHKLGHVAIYPGGGYPMELGTTYHETLTIVQDLKDKGWVDLLTRAVIFEFALYSPGSDITAMVAMLVEFPLTGGAIASYEVQSEKLLWFEDGKVDPLMVLECILFLVCLYSWVHLTLQIRELGRQFFKDWWNYYEIATTLMTTVTVGMYIGCVVEATSTFNEFLANMTSFTNFERTAYIHVGTRYLQAWLLFLLMYKVVKQLRFVKFMKVYEETLSAAFSHLLGTGLIFLILLMVYAQVGYLLYGRVLAEFETVGHAANTLLVMIRGHFNFLPMLDHQETFTHFYVYSYYAFAYGIMVALVVAILQSTYHTIKSQQTFKASIEMQDHEMIEFMLKRFKLWAGIQKPKPAFRRVRFPGFPSISSRSSSSYSNRSSASEQTVPATVVEQEFSRVQLNSMMARLTPTWNAVLKRMEKLEVLENDEEVLVKKAENEMKDLNWKCRINELERQRKELLNWKNQPGGSSKAPSGEGATQPRQSVGKRGPNRDNTERKAPATVTGGATRDQPSGNPGDEQGATGGRRPLSYQGARLEGTTPGTRRASSQDKNTQDKNTLQKFLKSVKPSKAAWNK
ncbi:hypothetical protein DPMN_027157 [Dreissena polymorpha]|uniref:Uncharacterized protein n=2 Tax=Dreissena polymorpha TaxID=45954 RepID=A0A9D4LSZ4_DREPO|nr:hypothetical protein DPMN_027157 [Dreissena polymorpha]